MCEPNEHAEMLAFIGKATFPKPQEAVTFTSPEELGSFMADFIAKMAEGLELDQAAAEAAPKQWVRARLEVKTKPVLRTWCRNCGHAAVECVGHEDCYHFSPEEYAASAAEQVEGIDPIPPGHPAYEDDPVYGSPF